MNTTATKHTPGPLHVGDGKRALIVYRSDGYAVADCKTFHGRISQQEAESNAVLFAAAPELLEALDSLLSLGVAEQFGNWEEWEEVKSARAAIAKATGHA